MLMDGLGSLLAGMAAAWTGGWLLLPLLRRLKARQFISSDAPARHQGKAGTPTMGGLILLAGAFLGFGLVAAPGGVSPMAWAVLLCTLGFAGVGFLDDLLIVLRGRNLGLRAREKLAGQFLVAGAFVAWHLVSRSGAGSAPAEAWAVALLAAFHLLLLVGMSNAVNLTDGLDGLASGVSLPVWLAVGGAGAVAAGATREAEAALFCAAFAGATLGYLWYNAHPAQVFMGDTGSLAIGGGLAAAGIALGCEWVLLVAGLVHLAEAASVTLQVISFKTTGRRIFKMSPLHHHFELCDWPETRIVVRFSLVSAACALLALLLFLHRQALS